MPRPASPLRRLPGWEQRLAEIVEERRNVPFAWGAQDCVTFASDVTLALTGVDVLAAHRGTYDTEEEAEAIIGPQGLGDFIAALLGGFGVQEMPPVYAQRGDWVLVSYRNQIAVGVVTGSKVAVTGGTRLDHGLGFLSLSAATRAWAV
jgi:hypothetical protein